MLSRAVSLDRLGDARVGHLATVDERGKPHIVPIVFALSGDRLVTAVDHKPKTTRRLKRLENIRANPAVSVLVDHYDDDWSGLWWVRVDGTATVFERGEEWEEAIAALVAKYPQYVEQPPDGPAIVIQILRVSSWSASD